MTEVIPSSFVLRHSSLPPFDSGSAAWRLSSAGWFWLSRFFAEFEASPAVPAPESRKGTPGLRDFVAGLPIRQFRQAVEISERCTHAQVLVREYVQAAEAEDEKHLCGPESDAFDPDQLGNHFFIGPSRELRQLDLSIQDLLGQVAQIGGFLWRQACGSHLNRSQPGEIFRGDTPGRQVALQTSMD